MKALKIIIPFLVVILITVVAMNLFSYYFQNNYLKKHPLVKSGEQIKDFSKQQMPRQIKGCHKIAELNDLGISRISQSPELEKLVRLNKLLPVKDRLPVNPLVIISPEQCAPYGGQMHRAGSGPSDIEAGTIYLMIEGLIQRSPDNSESWPNLASKWQILEKGAVFEFTLRKGLRWSDGHPLTTADIKFWHQHVLHNKQLTPGINPALQSPDGHDFELEIVDKYTLRFRFPEPAPNFITILERPLPWLGNYIIPAHYLKQFHEAFVSQEQLETICEAEGYPDWAALFKEKNKFHMNPDLPSIRAWIVKDTLPSTPVRFVRNPYYWKIDQQGNQLPYLDGLVVSVMDQSAINLAAQYGKLDFQGRSISPGSRPLLLKNARKKIFKLSSGLNLTSCGAICFNLNSPDKFKAQLFRNSKFKQAMSMGFDRKALIYAFTDGLGSASQTSFSKSSPYYREADAKAYIDFAPAVANKILDTLGLAKRDSNGFRCRPDGSSLVMYLEQPSISMKGSQASPLLMVCRYWQQELGMNVKYKPEARGLFYTRSDAGIHDIMWGGNNLVEVNLLPSNLAPCKNQSRWCPKWNKYLSSKGSSGEKPPANIMKLVKLRRQYEREIDTEKRVKILYKLLDANRKNIWVMPTVMGPPALYVVSNVMRNVPQVLVNPMFCAPECFAKTDNKGGSAPQGE